MKHHHSPPSDYESDLPVPLLFPVRKRHYIVALLLVLILSIALLCVVLLVSAGPFQTKTPQDSLPDPSPSLSTPQESEQAPPSEEASTPDSQEQSPSAELTTPDTATPTPEQLVQSESGRPEESTAQNPTQEPTDTPPVVIEQIVLSGSAALVYRSYGDGSCIVTGIGACTDRCLLIPTRSPAGDTVIAIGEEAFMGCDWLQAVQIPATVKSIGVRAFADCSSIVQFCVDDENTAFCAADGVLYSRDMTSLLCYPSGRSCPEAVIPATVQYISAQAFSPRGAYTTIRFEGTLNDWRAVRIEDGNQVLYTLPKCFAAS